MNEPLRTAIAAWKFADALALASKRTVIRYELLATLARLFGNSGWFDGDVGALVACAVDEILSGQRGERTVKKDEQ